MILTVPHDLGSSSYASIVIIIDNLNILFRFGLKKIMYSINILTVIFLFSTKANLIITYIRKRDRKVIIKVARNRLSVLR